MNKCRVSRGLSSLGWGLPLLLCESVGDRQKRLLLQPLWLGVTRFEEPWANGDNTKPGALTKIIKGTFVPLLSADGNRFKEGTGNKEGVMPAVLQERCVPRCQKP